MSPDSPNLDILVEFSRQVSDSRSPEAILSSMLESVAHQVHPDAAAVLELGEGGALRLAARKGLEAPAEPSSGSLEDLSSLGPQLAAACGAEFARHDVLPLVASGGLFGALVLYFRDRPGLAEEEHGLVRALVDLAAMALERAVRENELRHSYEELKASRQVLARSEKLRALGQMAATVSHDLKNVLNPLGLQLEVLKRRLVKSPEAARQTIEQIESAVKQGVETVERLRSFSRQEDQAVAGAASLDALAGDALELAGATERARREGVTLQRELGAPPEVSVNASELKSALVNLLVNAFEATGEGGTVTVRTGAEDGRSWIEVADTGDGIPAEIRPRLFEPFATTKGEAGTGLGLPMVYAAVKRQGGEISVDTGEGGTAFRLFFPQ